MRECAQRSKALAHERWIKFHATSGLARTDQLAERPKTYKLNSAATDSKIYTQRRVCTILLTPCGAPGTLASFFGHGTQRHAEILNYKRIASASPFFYMYIYWKLTKVQCLVSLKTRAIVAGARAYSLYQQTQLLVWSPINKVRVQEINTMPHYKLLDTWKLHKKIQALNIFNEKTAAVVS